MPNEFDIPRPQWPDEEKIINAVTARLRAIHQDTPSPTAEVVHTIPSHVVKGMASIATNVWKAKAKMLDNATGEVREEMKRVYRHIESVLETFDEIGLEVKDHTGDAFDYGLPLKVITTQPMQGVTRESVLETIKPTLYWQKQIIQMGEVVIATPISTEEKV